MIYQTDNVLIGKRIREARIRAGLTQNRLHQITDISITQISAYENGNRNIGLTSLKKIFRTICLNRRIQQGVPC